MESYTQKKMPFKRHRLRVPNVPKYVHNLSREGCLLYTYSSTVITANDMNSYRVLRSVSPSVCVCVCQHLNRWQIKRARIFTSCPNSILRTFDWSCRVIRPSMYTEPQSNPLHITIQSPVVTVCTTSLTFNNSTFCPHSVFMCFVWIWEQTAIISLYSINWPVFITEIQPFKAQWSLYVPPH